LLTKMGKTRRRRAYQITWPKPKETSSRDEDTSENETDVSRLEGAGAQTQIQETVFKNWLKDILKSNGVDDLFGLISAAVDKEMNKVVDKIKQTVTEECGRQKEMYDCTRSIIIHNANQLVMDSSCVESRGSLVDQVTSLLHTMCKISVLDAFSLGHGSNQPRTSVCIILGSSRQKANVFRMLLRHIKSKTGQEDAMCHCETAFLSIVWMM
jgi:uncharacterized protein YihD (DUF1040 family)